MDLYLPQIVILNSLILQSSDLSNILFTSVSNFSI